MTEPDKYVRLDAREIGSILGPKSIQTTVTSPPYFDCKNYGGVEKQIGWGQTLEEYLEGIRLVFEQCYSATREDGTLWVVVNTFKRKGVLKLLPLRIMEELEKAGWIPQDVVVWDKTKNLPYSRRGQFPDHFEYVLFLSKSSEFKYYVDRIRDIQTLKDWWIRYPERYHPLGKVPANIWRIAIPNQGSWSNGGIQHLCPFPPELAERIILLSTDEGDMVFDPFAGSGVLLAQAKCMNRRILGCDINEEYVERFSTEVLPEVRKLWSRRERELKKMDLAREEFRRTVFSLRKLKFARVLADRFLHVFGERKIAYIEVSSDDAEFEESFRLRVLLTPACRGQETEMKAWLEKRPSQRPFSKFGLKCSLLVEIAPEPYSSPHGGKDALYIYAEGKFYHPPKKWNEDMHALLQAEDFPPIISNIEVSLEPDRWKDYSSQ